MFNVSVLCFNQNYFHVLTKTRNKIACVSVIYVVKRSDLLEHVSI